jgi:Tfp pilus assembly protein PilF
VEQKKPEKAIQRLTQAIAKGPDQPNFHELLGRVYFSQKNYNKAEEEYRRILALDKTNNAAYQLLAQLYMVQGSFDKAVSSLESQIKARPDAVEPRLILGSLYESRGTIDKAQYYYRETLKLDAQSPIAANNLAWLLCENGGNLDEALNLARVAHAKLPKSTEAADTLGWVYYKRKAYMSAIEIFRGAIAQDPKRAIMHYHLGMSYYRNGQNDRAKDSLQKALDLDSKFPGASEANKVLQSISGK